jgi:uncharacterized protein
MRSALEQVLAGVVAPAVAVSGGVDSITLAAVADELLIDVCMVHAVSPAVPAHATARVQALARARGWQLCILDAGEFADPRYRDHLYGNIRMRTERQILSGANRDDLRAYRPGLEAAREFDVRHPFIEAGMGTAEVRRLARELGLAPNGLSGQ